MLFFCLLSSIFSITIHKRNLEQTLEAIQHGWAYTLVADSSEFEFHQLINQFKKAAHFSKVNATFAILDSSTYLEDVKTAFNVTQIPCVVFSNEGQVKMIQYRGFDEEYLISFITTNAVLPPSTITTKEELELFYSSSAVGLIIAFGDTSSDRYANLRQYYLEHYAEVNVVFANPTLFSNPGFYMYRFIDSTLIELPENLSELHPTEISDIISKHLLPEFTRLTGGLSSYLERLRSKFVILMLVMEDFYLTKEQLELSRQIKKNTGLNVTYADVENNQLLEVTYGLPDSLDSTMCVIDPSSSRLMKYMLSEPLNLDNAVKFIKSVQEGKAVPYYKSEPEGHSSKIGCQMTSINTKKLQLFVNQKKTVVLALYVASQDPMEEFVNATEIVKTNYKEVVFGKFSLNTNDWPLSDLNEEVQFPILYVVKNGKNVYSQTIANTTEAVTLQINEALNQNTEL